MVLLFIDHCIHIQQKYMLTQRDPTTEMVQGLLMNAASENVWGFFCSLQQNPTTLFNLCWILCLKHGKG